MVNDEIRGIAKRLAETLSPSKIYLFGSYAKDIYREDSDYDLYVLVPDNAGHPLDLATQGYRSLRGMQRKPVDLLVGRETSFQKRSQMPTIEREVKRDGVLLYEK